MHLSFTSDGKSVYNDIIVEAQNDFATYIKYRFSVRNYCFRCKKPFASMNELREHKREIHSY
jgi:hypothetical protein